MNTIWNCIKVVLLIIGAFVALDFLFDYHNGVITLDFKEILNKIF